MAELLQLLTPYKNAKHVIKHEQTVGDIMQGLVKCHELHRKEYDKIANYFRGKSTNEIAYKIWSYLKKNVKYVIEPDHAQFLKSPSAILATGSTTGSDCKNYSLFAGGILEALNRKGYKIPFVYRFASYRLNDKIPQHVFVVLNPNTKKEIWLDAVLPHYNQKKQYFYHIDKKPKMSLIALSGIKDNVMQSVTTSHMVRPTMTIEGIRDRYDFMGYVPSIGIENSSIGSFWGDLKKTLTKSGRKELFKKLKEAIKKAGKFVLKFAASPVRNAFLLLVRFNFRSIATNLKKVIDAGEGKKIFDIWDNFGGSGDKLKNAIGNGSKEKRLGEIGFAPAIIAALPVASPLLLKISKFIKPILEKLGVGKEDSEKVEQDATQAIEQKKQEVLQDIDKEAQGIPTKTGDKVVEDVKNPSGSGFPTKYLLIGGAAVAAIMIMKK